MKTAPSLKPINSPDSFQKHLHMYALAASAAGVSMLALASPAEAEIIYKSANTHIGLNQVVSFDLNGDGIVDFNFVDFWRNSTGGDSFGNLSVTYAQSGNAVMGTVGGRYASALRVGVPIGPNGKFSPSGLMAWGFQQTTAPYKARCYGPWKSKANRYLGLKFMISGEAHYGWARLTETCKKGENTALLSGYAYETIPNQAITSGKKKGNLEDEGLTGSESTPQSVPVPTPASLGMLAGGAPALSIWRRQ